MVGQTVTDLMLPEKSPFAPLTAGTSLSVLHIAIPMKVLWESLPQTVRDEWPSEAPQTGWNGEGHWRSPSALPDLEVVYQIIQIFEGDLEVQVETLLETPAGEDAAEAYQLRQLGKAFLGSFAGMTPPVEGESDDYRLNVSLASVSTVSLLRPYDLMTLGNRLTFDTTTKQLKWLGVLSAADRDALHLAMAAEIEELTLLRDANLAPNDQAILENWYVSRIVRSEAIAPADTPVPLPNIAGLRYANITPTLLLLDRSETVNVADLEAFANQCDTKLQAALLGLLGDATTNVVQGDHFAVAAVDLLAVSDLTNLPQEKVQQVDATRSEMTWLGSLSHTQSSAMTASLFDGAVARLKTRLRAAQATVEYEPSSPPPAIPTFSIGSFAIASNTPDEWLLQWTGELTAGAIRQIRGLMTDARFQAAATALFRQVLAGQKAYVDELPQIAERAEAAFENTRNQVDQLTEQLYNIDDRLRQLRSQTPPNAPPTPEQQRLETERRSLVDRRNPLLRQQEQEEQAARATRATADAATRTLNAALTELATPTSEEVTATPVAGNFLTTTYQQNLVWRVSRSLLQYRLANATPPVDTDWLQAGEAAAGPPRPRLLIPPESDQLTWRDLDDIDARAVQQQVQQVLDADQGLTVVSEFLNGFNSLIEAIAAQSFTFDYRPCQIDVPESLQESLIIRGRLLQATRPFSEEEQTRLKNRFFTPPSVHSLERFFIDLQDKAAIDRLYHRWLSQIYVPTKDVDLSGLSSALQAKVEARSLPADQEYALIWEGPISADERQIVSDWQSGLTDPAQIDAVSELLRQIGQRLERKITVTADGPAPALEPSVEELRTKLAVTTRLTTPSEYTLSWEGPISADERQTLQNWRLGLTDSAQVDAVSELLRQIDERSEGETVIIASGSAPDLNLSMLDEVRSRFRLGDGTILRYHGLMTIDEANALHPVIDHDASWQQLFNHSLQNSLQGGELRIMARRGSAKPSDLVPIHPPTLS
jgi:hypothetical protein